jgi:hypothetical protein
MGKFLKEKAATLLSNAANILYTLSKAAYAFIEVRLRFMQRRLCQPNPFSYWAFYVLFWAKYVQ